MSGKADASYQRVRSHLGALGMDAVAECLAGELEAAQKKKPSYADFLDRLLGVEVAAVEAKSHERRLRLAGFPSHKRLEEFDFSAQPNLDRRVIEELATLRFVEERSNIVLIGQPRWAATMRFWAGRAVLVVDELGYLPMPGEAASHLFQVISRRYEKGATILTTNRESPAGGDLRRPGGRRGDDRPPRPPRRDPLPAGRQLPLARQGPARGRAA